MDAELIAGRYRLQQKIGDGGMAMLYRAVDVSLGREVAVKILREDMANDPAAVQSFRRESHAAARLQHPSIVQIYDTGVQNGTYYIVMEYLREPNLKKIVVEYAPLPLRKALEVAVQVCEAIEYAHNNDIVHRDIKPQNVLFTDDGRAKVGDFGIASAAVAADPSGTSAVLGSEHYTSPEQAQGHPASPQSDLYSLGAVLYECLTGRPPFEGECASEIATRHVRDRPTSPRALNANVTPSTEYVVMKALSKDLSRRYRSASEMLHDLRKLQEGVGLERTGIMPMPAESVPMSPAEASEPSAPPAPARARGEERLRPTPAEDEGPPLRTALAVGGALLLVLVLMAYGALRLMYPNAPPPRVHVPRVVGKTTADASTILGRARLVLGNQTTQEDESRQPGTIISQDPEFGEFVDENTPVDIVVVGGVGSVIVPDVVGQTPQDADTMLKRSELVLGNVEPRYSDEVAAGRIIEQDVRAGTNHPKGDAVNVAVSRGPALDEGMLDPDGDLPADEPPGGDLPEDDEASAESQTPPIIAVEPADGRANVRVALGRGQGPRRIRIVKTDEEVRGMAVLDRLVHPGTGLNEWIDVKGRGTIEIYVDGELLRPSYDVGTPSAAPPPVVPEGRETP